MTITPQPDPTDWKVGDQALCVFKGPWHNLQTGEPSHGPAWGTIHVVSKTLALDMTTLGLGFPGYGDDLFVSNLFRKLEPYEPTEEDLNVYETCFSTV